MAEVIQAYPGCPTLSWVLASRICNKKEDADAFVTVTGRKGSGKSTASLALCEDVAECVSYIRGKKENPDQFFNINHVVTITKEGALKLLTSGILQRENSVVLLDDSGAAMWNARQFASWFNQALNSILMIARVYRCLIVCNSILLTHIDKSGREMTDYRIRMLRKSTITKQALFRCYYYDISDDGAEYRHHLTWHGHRIRAWVIGLPSDKLRKQYEEMRRMATDEHVEKTYSEMEERMNPKKNKRGEFIIEYGDEVRAEYEKNPNVRALSRKYGVSEHLIGKCLGDTVITRGRK